MPPAESTDHLADGIHRMAPREAMSASVCRLRDTYAMVPGAPLYKREFGYYCLDEWKEQGMPQDVPLSELFDFDGPAQHSLGQLGWCEAAFAPGFEDKVLEVIANKYKFVYPIPEEVKKADLMSLATERRDIMAPIVEEWGSLVGVEPFRDRICPNPPRFAEAAFLVRFKELCPDGVWL